MWQALGKKSLPPSLPLSQPWCILMITLCMWTNFLGILQILTVIEEDFQQWLGKLPHWSNFLWRSFCMTGLGTLEAPSMKWNLWTLDWQEQSKLIERKWPFPIICNWTMGWNDGSSTCSFLSLQGNIPNIFSDWIQNSKYTTFFFFFFLKKPILWWKSAGLLYRLPYHASDCSNIHREWLQICVDFKGLLDYQAWSNQEVDLQTLPILGYVYTGRKSNNIA